MSKQPSVPPPHHPPSPLTDVLETVAVVRRDLAAASAAIHVQHWARALELVDEAWTQLHELRCRFETSLDSSWEELEAAVGVLPGTSRQVGPQASSAPSEPLSPPAAAAPPGGLATEQSPVRDVPLW